MDVVRSYYMLNGSSLLFRVEKRVAVGGEDAGTGSQVVANWPVTNMQFNLTQLQHAAQSRLFYKRHTCVLSKLH